MTASRSGNRMAEQGPAYCCWAAGFSFGPRSKIDGFSFTLFVMPPTSVTTFETLSSMEENLATIFGSCSRTTESALLSREFPGPDPPASRPPDPSLPWRRR